ncbi:flagellar basal body-associated FliL family protein [Uliginosibacterium sp. H3]|uniref:Flagellar protein FliL n=1 Tax=Uliginosibacterium silvisoli TaxID=3114758 RepID=A0ABU6K4M9_9RHOO|nr:flagellar basal body-associated FliL family protein [Uliginosibacterium sp. H3]
MTNQTPSARRFAAPFVSARLAPLLLALSLAWSPLASASGHGGGGESAGPAPLQFTVNVNSANGASGFVQVALVLSPANEEATKEFDLYRPMVMHYINLVIAGFSAETLRSVTGKDKLAESIAQRVNKELGLTRKTGVANVFFTSFIVQ